MERRIGSWVVALPLVAVSVVVSLPAGAQTVVAEEAPAATVVVTARKREERIVDVPVAVSTFSEQTMRDYDIRDFADYADKVPGLSWAYGNGTIGGETGTAFANARTVAIRGIAGARTTGYYLDDTPLPGAVDVRVVDLSDIEILRGPQGTLFGESSLGGNVRLISKAPNLKRNEFRYMVEAGWTKDGGSLNRGGEAVGNLVLAEGRAALRATGFVAADAGWLTRSYRSDINNPASARREVDDQGASRARGGSLTGLFRLTPDLDLTLRLIHQNQRYDKGAPMAYAPLPSFEPEREIDHLASLQPKSSDRWTLPVLVLNYRGEGWSLTSSTSKFSRLAKDSEDSTEGSIKFLDSYGLGATPAQGFLWTASRQADQFAHETRIAFDPVGAFSGIVGIHHSLLKTHRETPPVYGTNVLGVVGQSKLWEFDDRYRQEDTSVFGELYIALSERYTLTLGNRHYWLRQRDKSSFSGSLYGSFTTDTNNRSEGDNPKLALAYKPDTRSLYYVSATKGFRAGGAIEDYANSYGCALGGKTKPDTLWSYEVGGKLQLAEDKLLLTGAAYRIDWQDIQQPSLDPICQFYIVGNAGNARIDGAEVELSGEVAAGLRVRASVGYSDSRITKQGDVLQPVGSRVLQIPDWTASLGFHYTRRVSERLTGFVSADYNYVGDSLSATSSALSGLNQTLERPSYALLNARVGVRWAKSELSLNMRNLTNERPNLGDVGYLGYLRYEADGTTPRPQVVTSPPRTFMLTYRESF